MNSKFLYLSEMPLRYKIDMAHCFEPLSIPYGYKFNVFSFTRIDLINWGGGANAQGGDIGI